MGHEPGAPLPCEIDHVGSSRANAAPDAPYDTNRAAFAGYRVARVWRHHHIMVKRNQYASISSRVSHSAMAQASV